MQLLRLLLTLTLAVLAPATVPAPQPHNVLTIKVYTTYTEIYDNGQLVTVFDDSCDNPHVWNTNAHRCNGDVSLMADLTDGYLPLPYEYAAAVAAFRYPQGMSHVSD